MPTYKITCATKTHQHRHITKIGGPSGSWTVTEAGQAIDNGTHFFTQSPSTNKTARVIKFDCPWCPYKSLTTTADAVWDNNLDNLPNCP